MNHGNQQSYSNAYPPLPDQPMWNSQIFPSQHVRPVTASNSDQGYTGGWNDGNVNYSNNPIPGRPISEGVHREMDVHSGGLNDLSNDLGSVVDADSINQQSGRSYVQQENYGMNNPQTHIIQNQTMTNSSFYQGNHSQGYQMRNQHNVMHSNNFHKQYQQIISVQNSMQISSTAHGSGQQTFPQTHRLEQTASYETLMLREYSNQQSNNPPVIQPPHLQEPVIQERGMNIFAQQRSESNFSSQFVPQQIMFVGNPQQLQPMIGSHGSRPEQTIQENFSPHAVQRVQLIHMEPNNQSLSFTSTASQHSKQPIRTLQQGKAILPTEQLLGQSSTQQVMEQLAQQNIHQEAQMMLCGQGPLSGYPYLNQASAQQPVDQPSSYKNRHQVLSVPNHMETNLSQINPSSMIMRGNDPDSAPPGFSTNSPQGNQHISPQEILRKKQLQKKSLDTTKVQHGSATCSSHMQQPYSQHECQGTSSNTKVGLYQHLSIQNHLVRSMHSQSIDRKAQSSQVQSLSQQQKRSSVEPPNIMINDHPLIRDILKQPRILQREIENEIGESSEQIAASGDFNRPGSEFDRYLQPHDVQNNPCIDEVDPSIFLDMSTEDFFKEDRRSGISTAHQSSNSNISLSQNNSNKADQQESEEEDEDYMFKAPRKNLTEDVEKFFHGIQASCSQYPDEADEVDSDEAILNIDSPTFPETRFSIFRSPSSSQNDVSSPPAQDVHSPVQCVVLSPLQVDIPSSLQPNVSKIDPSLTSSIVPERQAGKAARQITGNFVRVIEDDDNDDEENSSDDDYTPTWERSLTRGRQREKGVKGGKGGRSSKSIHGKLFRGSTRGKGGRKKHVFEKEKDNLHLPSSLTFISAEDADSPIQVSEHQTESPVTSQKLLLKPTKNVHKEKVELQLFCKKSPIRYAPRKDVKQYQKDCSKSKDDETDYAVENLKNLYINCNETERHKKKHQLRGKKKKYKSKELISTSDDTSSDNEPTISTEETKNQKAQLALESRVYQPVKSTMATSSSNQRKPDKHYTLHSRSKSNRMTTRDTDSEQDRTSQISRVHFSDSSRKNSKKISYIQDIPEAARESADTDVGSKLFSAIRLIQNPQQHKKKKKDHKKERNDEDKERCEHESKNKKQEKEEKSKEILKQSMKAALLRAIERKKQEQTASRTLRLKIEQRAQSSARYENKKETGMDDLRRTVSHSPRGRVVVANTGKNREERRCKKTIDRGVTRSEKCSRVIDPFTKALNQTGLRMDRSKQRNIHITSEAPTQSLIEIQKNMAAIKEEQRKKEEEKRKEDQKIRRTQEEAKRRSREKRLAQEPRTSAGSSERKSASSQSHSTPITVKVVAQPLSTPARSVQHSGLISMKTQKTPQRQRNEEKSIFDNILLDMMKTHSEKLTQSKHEENTKNTAQRQLNFNINGDSDGIEKSQSLEESSRRLEECQITKVSSKYTRSKQDVSMQFSSTQSAPMTDHRSIDNSLARSEYSQAPIDKKLHDQAASTHLNACTIPFGQRSEETPVNLLILPVSTMTTSCTTLKLLDMAKTEIGNSNESSQLNSSRISSSISDHKNCHLVDTKTPERDLQKISNKHIFSTEADALTSPRVSSNRASYSKHSPRLLFSGSASSRDVCVLSTKNSQNTDKCEQDFHKEPLGQTVVKVNPPSVIERPILAASPKSVQTNMPQNVNHRDLQGQVPHFLLRNTITQNTPTKSIFPRDSESIRLRELQKHARNYAISNLKNDSDKVDKSARSEMNRKKPTTSDAETNKKTIGLGEPRKQQESWSNDGVWGRNGPGEVTNSVRREKTVGILENTIGNKFTNGQSNDLLISENTSEENCEEHRDGELISIVTNCPNEFLEPQEVTLARVELMPCALSEASQLPVSVTSSNFLIQVDTASILKTDGVLPLKLSNDLPQEPSRHSPSGELTCLKGISTMMESALPTSEELESTAAQGVILSKRTSSELALLQKAEASGQTSFAPLLQSQLERILDADMDDNDTACKDAIMQLGLLLSESESSTDEEEPLPQPIFSRSPTPPPLPTSFITNTEELIHNHLEVTHNKLPMPTESMDQSTSVPHNSLENILITSKMPQPLTSTPMKEFGLLRTPSSDSVSMVFDNRTLAELNLSITGFSDSYYLGNQSMSEELGNVTEDSRITSEENLSRNFYISENTRNNSLEDFDPSINSNDLGFPSVQVDDSSFLMFNEREQSEERDLGGTICPKCDSPDSAQSMEENVDSYSAKHSSDSCPQMMPTQNRQGESVSGSSQNIRFTNEVQLRPTNNSDTEAELYDKLMTNILSEPTKRKVDIGLNNLSGDLDVNGYLNERKEPEGNKNSENDRSSSEPIFQAKESISRKEKVVGYPAKTPPIESCLISQKSPQKSERGYQVDPYTEKDDFPEDFLEPIKDSGPANVKQPSAQAVEDGLFKDKSEDVESLLMTINITQIASETVAHDERAYFEDEHNKKIAELNTNKTSEEPVQFISHDMNLLPDDDTIDEHTITKERAEQLQEIRPFDTSLSSETNATQSNLVETKELERYDLERVVRPPINLQPGTVLMGQTKSIYWIHNGDGGMVKMRTPSTASIERERTEMNRKSSRSETQIDEAETTKVAKPRTRRSADAQVLGNWDDEVRRANERSFGRMTRSRGQKPNYLDNDLISSADNSVKLSSTHGEEEGTNACHFTIVQSRSHSIPSDDGFNICMETVKKVTEHQKVFDAFSDEDDELNTSESGSSTYEETIKATRIRQRRYKKSKSAEKDDSSFEKFSTLKSIDANLRTASSTSMAKDVRRDLDSDLQIESATEDKKATNTKVKPKRCRSSEVQMLQKNSIGFGWDPISMEENKRIRKPIRPNLMTSFHCNEDLSPSQATSTAIEKIPGFEEEFESEQRKTRKTERSDHNIFDRDQSNSLNLSSFIDQALNEELVRYRSQGVSPSEEVVKNPESPKYDSKNEERVDIKHYREEIPEVTKVYVEEAVSTSMPELSEKGEEMHVLDVSVLGSYLDKVLAGTSSEYCSSVIYSEIPSEQGTKAEVEPKGLDVLPSVVGGCKIVQTHTMEVSIIECDSSSVLSEQSKEVTSLSQDIAVTHSSTESTFSATETVSALVEAVVTLMKDFSPFIAATVSTEMISTPVNSPESIKTIASQLNAESTQGNIFSKKIVSTTQIEATNQSSDSEQVNISDSNVLKIECSTPFMEVIAASAKKQKIIVKTTQSEADKLSQNKKIATEKDIVDHLKAPLEENTTEALDLGETAKALKSTSCTQVVNIKVKHRQEEFMKTISELVTELISIVTSMEKEENLALKSLPKKCRKRTTENQRLQLDADKILGLSTEASNATTKKLRNRQIGTGVRSRSTDNEIHHKSMENFESQSISLSFRDNLRRTVSCKELLFQTVKQTLKELRNDNAIVVQNINESTHLPEKVPTSESFIQHLPSQSNNDLSRSYELFGLEAETEEIPRRVSLESSFSTNETSFAFTEATNHKKADSPCLFEPESNVHQYLTEVQEIVEQTSTSSDINEPSVEDETIEKVNKTPVVNYSTDEMKEYQLKSSSQTIYQKNKEDLTKFQSDLDNAPNNKKKEKVVAEGITTMISEIINTGEGALNKQPKSLTAVEVPIKNLIENDSDKNQQSIENLSTAAFSGIVKTKKEMQPKCHRRRRLNKEAPLDNENLVKEDMTASSFGKLCKKLKTKRGEHQSETKNQVEFGEHIDKQPEQFKIETLDWKELSLHEEEQEITMSGSVKQGKPEENKIAERNNEAVFAEDLEQYSKNTNKPIVSDHEENQMKVVKQKRKRATELDKLNWDAQKIREAFKDFDTNGKKLRNRNLELRKSYNAATNIRKRVLHTEQPDEEDKVVIPEHSTEEPSADDSCVEQKSELLLSRRSKLNRKVHFQNKEKTLFEERIALVAIAEKVTAEVAETSRREETAKNAEYAVLDVRLKSTAPEKTKTEDFVSVRRGRKRRSQSIDQSFSKKLDVQEEIWNALEQDTATDADKQENNQACKVVVEEKKKKKKKRRGRIFIWNSRERKIYNNMKKAQQKRKAEKATSAASDKTDSSVQIERRLFDESQSPELGEPIDTYRNTRNRELDEISYINHSCKQLPIEQQAVDIAQISLHSSTSAEFNEKLEGLETEDSEGAAQKEDMGKFVNKEEGSTAPTQIALSIHADNRHKNVSKDLPTEELVGWLTNDADASKVYAPVPIKPNMIDPLQAIQIAMNSNILAHINIASALFPRLPIVPIDLQSDISSSAFHRVTEVDRRRTIEKIVEELEKKREEPQIQQASGNEILKPSVALESSLDSMAKSTDENMRSQLIEAAPTMEETLEERLRKHAALNWKPIFISCKPQLTDCLQYKKLEWVPYIKPPGSTIGPSSPRKKKWIEEPDNTPKPELKRWKEDDTEFKKCRLLSTDRVVYNFMADVLPEFNMMDPRQFSGIDDLSAPYHIRNKDYKDANFINFAIKHYYKELTNYGQMQVFESLVDNYEKKTHYYQRNYRGPNELLYVEWAFAGARSLLDAVNIIFKSDRSLVEWLWHRADRGIKGDDDKGNEIPTNSTGMELVFYRFMRYIKEVVVDNFPIFVPHKNRPSDADILRYLDINEQKKYLLLYNELRRKRMPAVLQMVLLADLDDFYARNNHHLPENQYDKEELKKIYFLSYDPTLKKLYYGGPNSSQWCPISTWCKSKWKEATQEIAYYRREIYIFDRKIAVAKGEGHQRIRGGRCQRIPEDKEYLLQNIAISPPENIIVYGASLNKQSYWWFNYMQRYMPGYFPDVLANVLREYKEARCEGRDFLLELPRYYVNEDEDLVECSSEKTKEVQEFLEKIMEAPGDSPDTESGNY